MEGKDSFVFYISWFRYFNKLKTIEQREKLRILLQDYVTDKFKDIPIEEISCGDDAVDMAFFSIAEDLKKDLSKWKTTCSNRAKAGQLGGLAKARNSKQNVANLANAKNAKSDVANLADNEYEYEYDNEYVLSKDNDINSRSDNQKLSNSIVYKLIFDTWNQQDNLIQHKELTKVRIEAIKKALKNYEPNIIVQAIKNYSEVLNSNYRFTYKWDLETFLKQSNAMPQFTDEGSVWNNYLREASKNAAIMPQEPRETPNCFKDFFGKIK